MAEHLEELAARIVGTLFHIATLRDCHCRESRVSPHVRQGHPSQEVSIPRLSTCDAYSIKLRTPQPGPKEASSRSCIAAQSRAWDTIKPLGPSPIGSVD